MEHNTSIPIIQTIDERKNLLDQFNLWKSKKRRKYHIVVNEKGKREMVEADEAKNKKRGK